MQPRTLLPPSLVSLGLAISRNLWILWYQLFYSMVSDLYRCALRSSSVYADMPPGMYPTVPKPSAAAGSYYASTTRLMRAYLKDILSNPESRKIFYFLMLNMCYMLVQMLYGVWTNSLGLISDGALPSPIPDIPQATNP